MNLSKKNRILITGGTGFVGSHIAAELMTAGHDVVLLDNCINSSRDVVDDLRALTGKACTFVRGDLTSSEALEHCFGEGAIDLVIHTAALKSVPESVAVPLDYYRNNSAGTILLIEAMQKNQVRNLVFTSSAAVYSPDNPMPVSEDGALEPINPFGSSKAMVEEVLKDLYHADNRWDISIIRYFNAAGAHRSGLLGALPVAISSNLMPCMIQVAQGIRQHLLVFGGDYPTVDGTAVRDFIHVEDVAKAHIAAIGHMKGLQTYNVGTGTGYSVLEVIRTFENVNRVKIPYEIVERRSGDVGASWANTKRITLQTGWKAEQTLEDICRDAWKRK